MRYFKFKRITSRQNGHSKFFITSLQGLVNLRTIDATLKFAAESTQRTFYADSNLHSSKITQYLEILFQVSSSFQYVSLTTILGLVLRHFFYLRNLNAMQLQWFFFFLPFLPFRSLSPTTASIKFCCFKSNESGTLVAIAFHNVRYAPCKICKHAIFISANCLVLFTLYKSVFLLPYSSVHGAVKTTFPVACRFRSRAFESYRIREAWCEVFCFSIKEISLSLWTLSDLIGSVRYVSRSGVGVCVGVRYLFILLNTPLTGLFHVFLL